MPRFAANLHYLFAEVPFLDRFAAAADCGFRGVEFQVPYDYPAAELRTRLRDHDLTMVLFDAPMGDWNAGDRGLAAVPGREAEFRASLERILPYAEALGCDTVHVMAGVVPPGGDYALAERTYLDNLGFAARFLEPHGVHAVIEPINRRMGIISTRWAATGRSPVAFGRHGQSAGTVRVRPHLAEGAAPQRGVATEGSLGGLSSGNGPNYTTEGMHGYFLNHSEHARRVIDAVAHPNLSLHLDCYHMQVLEGHLADTIRDNIALVRHFQIAGVPGRHEPDVGEIHYPYLFDLIDTLGYRGWIGCEYRPRGDTRAGLGWAAPYGIRPAAS